MFQAVNTIKGFDDVSLPKVIPSHQFVFGEKPEKYMNFRGNSQFPDSRDKHGLNPSKVDNMIEGAGGILPLIVQLQIRASGSAVKEMLLAISSNWNHCSMRLSLKFLLKESFRH